MQANFQTNIRHNTISHRRSERLKLGKPSQGQCDPFLLFVLPVEHSSVLDLRRQLVLAVVTFGLVQSGNV